MTAIFLLVVLILTCLESAREKNPVNMVSLLAMPYFIIVFLNNFFVYRLGFYLIEDRVLLMLMASIAAFFAGSCLASPGGVPLIAEESNGDRFGRYNIRAMTAFLLFIGFAALMKFLRLYSQGLFRGDRFDESEGLMNRGVIGHLLLISYSVLPIIFLYWLEHREKWICLLATGLIVCVTFTTLVKYNVIGVVVNLFVFTMLYKKSLFKKGVVVLVGLVVLLFVGNYFLGFYLRDITVDPSFYVDHFWVYAAGSTIYDNHLFDFSITQSSPVLYRVMIFLIAFPNMFIKKLTGGKGVFLHVKKEFLPVGVRKGQIANVTDAFGYLFPVRGSAAEVMTYFLFIVATGFLFMYLYVKAGSRKEYFYPFISCLLTYFVFFSFFGNFYVNPGPWEVLIYSLVVPNLFLYSSDLRKGTIYRV